MIRLLVVDDSALMRRLIGGIFEAESDFVVEIARNGAEAMAKLHVFEPDVITLDIHMPEMDGLACLDRIMIERPCPVVMVSQRTESGAAETMQALELGAVDFVPKPEGAVSLDIDSLAPRLIEKVRAAAQARIRPTLRLAERVRAKVGRQGARPALRRGSAPTRAEGTRAPLRPLGSDGLVLVGTSTGGPQALDALLTPLPADFPWPILVAQHMPSSFTGALARRLDKACALQVVEVSAPTSLAAGTVYVARGDADMIVRRQRGVLIASAAPAASTFRWHPSVDRLVQSAMTVVPPERLVGILMTGMGNDGAATLTELHRNGGYVIAEAEESAIVWGMPGELVKSGGADAVVPLTRIAACLVEAFGCR
ncbi:chemotaxis-specific protein-glutamate methyltransferase CheB [Sphingomonas sp. KRR8]|uniref:chemotaxis-specific protein-glutamate methyltransferase CheB n=1 Tax=Sphingomonas sp. KRR8 TaxID=2942996 RepID=UPI00201FF5E9|nr:chemotaxis-specific protein-glutamate methyltransferase CheB [Sphingomonas sp. KRR8]URD60777.1 chemotaxis-specific protein-glutamate methyltransferase CheB [Sphingomonas sp. KRR8]